MNANNFRGDILGAVFLFLVCIAAKRRDEGYKGDTGRFPLP
jgi:hypothetical protein